MSLQVTEFNIAKFLTDDQAIAIYLGDALENEDAHGIVDALNDVVSSRGGAAQLASSTGVAENVIHEALRDTPSPNFAAILAVLHGLGVKLTTARAA